MKVKGKSRYVRIVRAMVLKLFDLSSVQFSSVAQSCPTICDPKKKKKIQLEFHHLH